MISKFVRTKVLPGCCMPRCSECFLHPALTCPGQAQALQLSNAYDYCNAAASCVHRLQHAQDSLPLKLATKLRHTANLILVSGPHVQCFHDALSWHHHEWGANHLPRICRGRERGCHGGHSTCLNRPTSRRWSKDETFFGTGHVKSCQEHFATREPALAGRCRAQQWRGPVPGKPSLPTACA